MSQQQTPAQNQAQVDRIEEAVRTMAWWLYQAQTGFGMQDAQGIERILDGSDDSASVAAAGEPT